MHRLRSVAVALALVAPLLAAAAGGHAAPASGRSADAVLRALKGGNARFIAGVASHPNATTARVKETSKGQHPSAIILGCADSRVPPEVVFDQGIGDLFVVRAAGNVSEPYSLGSIEYAAEHLGVPLLVVLGHHSCGAVKATLDGAGTDGNLGQIVKEIRPAVAAIKGTTDKAGPLHAAVHQHARNVAAELAAESPILKGLIDAGKLKVAVAVYDLDTGVVEWE